jgi:hypothetical protein
MHLAENEVESPPCKRQLRSSTFMNHKQAINIPSSESESEEEPSDTESLGGSIIDDDSED